MTHPIIIFGTGDIAELAHFYFTQDGGRQVAAFTVDAAYVKSGEMLGLPLVPFEQVEDRFPPGRFDMFVATGYGDINRFRRRKCDEARRKGYRLASYVSSKATLWPQHTSDGENRFILEHNNIQPFVTLGNNVTLWSSNHIGHHSVIEDDCFLASQVVIAGYVTVGKGTFIGINATLRDHIRIGEHCVIGAGATVLKDVPDYTVIAGHPGQKLPMRSDRLKHL